MLKGGVGTFLVEHYRIGWSDKMNRVVIPIWNELHELEAVQSRAVYPDQKPKYLNKAGRRNHTALFWSDDEVMIDEPRGDWVVLTEDILSTVRVGRLQPAVASLGTSVNHRAASYIIAAHPSVLIWYDPDPAGLAGAAKARKVFELQGADVRIVRADKDPKMYSNEDIKRIIREHTK